ncbi:MAG: hypothetical protein GKR89_34370 [Candidatus Latescibacteria bacterium]|nr:hypothetical protein [Candidatus Latescibacterota bacterium]
MVKNILRRWRLGVLLGTLLVPALWVGWGVGRAWYVERMAWDMYRGWGYYQRQSILCGAATEPDIRVDYASFVRHPLRPWTADIFHGTRRYSGYNFNPLHWHLDIGGPSPENLRQAIDQQGDLNTVVGYLEAGADANAVWTFGGDGDKDSSSPLLQATAQRRPDMIAALLAYGADIDGVRFIGGKECRAIQWAGQERLWDSFMALLAAGADVGGFDLWGQTLLHRAAADNFVPGLESLLKAGLPVDSRDTTGATALHCAVEVGALEAVQALLAAGADVNAEARRWGFTRCTVLHAAVWAALEWVSVHRPCGDPDLEILQLILRAGANRDAVAILGSEPQQYVDPIQGHRRGFLDPDQLPFPLPSPGAQFTPLKLAVYFFRGENLQEDEYRSIIQLLKDPLAQVDG